MLTEGIRLMVACIDDLENAVAKVAGAVVHRNGHILYKVVFSVIIAQIFHFDPWRFLSVILSKCEIFFYLFIISHTADYVNKSAVLKNKSL